MSGTYDAHYVICPYCEYKHGDAWEITGNDERERKMECEGCGKAFLCWADVSTYYGAEPIEDAVARPTPTAGGG